MGLDFPATAPGFGRGVAPPTRCPWPQAWGVGYLLLAPPLTSEAGYLLLAAPADFGRGVAPLGGSCAVAVWYSRPLPLTLDVGLTPLGHRPSGMGSSWLLHLTSDVGVAPLGRNMTRHVAAACAMARLSQSLT